MPLTPARASPSAACGCGRRKNRKKSNSRFAWLFIEEEDEVVRVRPRCLSGGCPVEPGEGATRGLPPAPNELEGSHSPISCWVFHSPGVVSAS